MKKESTQRTSDESRLLIASVGRITTVKLPFSAEETQTLLPSPPPAPVRFPEWDSETESGGTEAHLGASTPLDSPPVDDQFA